MSFIDFWRESFPSLPQEQANKIRTQFVEYGVTSDWVFAPTNLKRNDFAQGDIVGDLKSVFLDYDEEKKSTKILSRESCDAIILTNSCDLIRKDYITLIPLFEAKQYFLAIKNAGLESEIKKNTTHSILFFPQSADTPDYVGDLNLCFSITLDLFRKQI